MLLMVVSNKPTMDYGRNMVDMKKLRCNIWFLWLSNVCTLGNAELSWVLQIAKTWWELWAACDVALENNASSYMEQHL